MHPGCRHQPRWLGTKHSVHRLDDKLVELCSVSIRLQPSDQLDGRLNPFRGHRIIVFVCHLCRPWLFGGKPYHASHMGR